MGEPQKLKSLNTQIRAFVSFNNKTDRPLALEWLDFDGNHQSYAERLEPGKSSRMNTFVGHPWLFYESDCRHQLVVLPDQSTIHFPVAWDHQSTPVYHDVNITNPLLSLREICLNKIHRHISITLNQRDKDPFMVRANQLGLPRVLVHDLKRLSEDQHEINMPVYIVPDTTEQEA